MYLLPKVRVRLIQRIRRAGGLSPKAPLDKLALIATGPPDVGQPQFAVLKHCNSLIMSSRPAR
jgi:hypothetical protein